ncbi:hypothetical protein ACFLQN_04735 [Candidatus Aenigmatarchaeota archaeon]
MAKKLKVGIFSFTGDEGCVIVFQEIMNRYFYEWAKYLDFKFCRILQSKNVIEDIDVSFVEGAVATYKDEDKLKKIRENSKKVVAIGSCAINGAPSNHRNFFDEKTTAEIQFILDRFGHRPKVSSISEIIEVDDKVPGCPIIEEKFLEVLNKYLLEFGVVSDPLPIKDLWLKEPHPVGGKNA